MCVRVRVLSQAAAPVDEGQSRRSERLAWGAFPDGRPAENAAEASLPESRGRPVKPRSPTAHPFCKAGRTVSKPCMRGKQAVQGGYIARRLYGPALETVRNPCACCPRPSPLSLPSARVSLSLSLERTKREGKGTRQVPRLRDTLPGRPVVLLLLLCGAETSLSRPGVALAFSRRGSMVRGAQIAREETRERERWWSAPGTPKAGVCGGGWARARPHRPKRPRRERERGEAVRRGPRSLSEEEEEERRRASNALRGLGACDLVSCLGEKWLWQRRGSSSVCVCAGFARGSKWKIETRIVSSLWQHQGPRLCSAVTVLRPCVQPLVVSSAIAVGRALPYRNECAASLATRTRGWTANARQVR